MPTANFYKTKKAANSQKRPYERVIRNRIVDVEGHVEHGWSRQMDTRKYKRR